MLSSPQIEVVQSQSGKQESLVSLLAGKGFVVEFVGPTGSGKSTNCNYLSHALQSEGLKVLLFRDIKRYFWGLSFFGKVRVITSTLNRHSRALFQYVILLVNHRIFSADSLSRYFRLCAFNTVLERVKERDKPDIILLDQWIIQGLWSATILKADEYQLQPAEVKKFFFKTDLVIYLDVDVATANERIKARASGDSRLDKMEDTERLSTLKKYTHYLFGLYRQSDCKTKWMFSAYASPEENVARFLLLLNEKLNENQR